MLTDTLPIEISQDGVLPGCVTVTLEQPGRAVVVLDHDLIRRLDATLRSVPRDAAGLILASASERSFVAGADLKSISEWDDEHLAAYLRYGSEVFGILTDMPFPTVAAINGAALGGGLELALHCDGLVAAPAPSGKPYPIGLPEAGLGLCPGWGGSNMLPARMDPAQAIELAARGVPLKYDAAVEAGLFDAVVDDPADLHTAAEQWLASRAQTPTQRDGAPARWIGRPNVAANVLAALDRVRPDLPDTDAARAVADSVDAGLTSGWSAGLECEQRRLMKLRNTQTARDAISAFFERSAKK